MFKKEDFVSHSGLPLTWKIDADCLTDDDLACLAYVASKTMFFGSVYGIPRGGVRFADALRPYCRETSSVRLVVDDVCTTGRSFNDCFQKGDLGLVIFNRGICPFWVVSMFDLGGFFKGVK